jgi:hypothetical protein
MVGLAVAVAGALASDLTLHADQGTTSVAEPTHTARPILLDLADRPDLRETARDWQHRIDVQHRIDIHTTETDHRPADSLLTRPEGHIAWAATATATIDETTDTAVLALREALSGSFGTPLKMTAPIFDQPS